jgi:hypothetical protein
MSVPIALPERKHWRMLRAEAMANYNELHFNHGKWASSRDDQDFLDRITVNYLRHGMTNYEDLLAATFGCVGTGDAYSIIKGRVFDAIASAYPSLGKECLRQEARLAMKIEGALIAG